MKRVSKDDKLFEKSKIDYKMSMEPLHDSLSLALLRKHKNGYWNFVSWLTSEDEFKTKVLADVKS